MITNSSSTPSGTNAQLSSNSSTFQFCLISTKGFEVFFAYTAANFLLLLPLSTLILHMGFQKWRQQRSANVEARSPADLFTYHIVAMELFSLMGSSCFCVGNYMGNRNTIKVGFYIFTIVFPGQTLFHCLTCVEHYLAVVHPITYLGLRKAGGITIRNVSSGCVWLVCCGWMGIAHLYLPNLPMPLYILLFASSLFVNSFCSVSVLRALNRPGPGQGAGDRVDQSKQRAFHIIVAITSALIFRIAGIIVCIVMFKVLQVSGRDACVVIKCTFWMNLPASLVLPLLFLHKEGKLACFGHIAESRRR